MSDNEQDSHTPEEPRGEVREPLPDGLEQLKPAAEEPAPQVEGDAEPEAAAAGTEALAGALKASFMVLKIAMVGLVAFWLLRGVYRVRFNEVRFKLRGGALAKVDDSVAIRSTGELRLRLPWEDMVVVDTTEHQFELNDEFWTRWIFDLGSQKTSLNVRTDGFLLTGDASIVHMRLRVRYRRRSDAAGALAAAFGVKDPEEVLRREVMASTTKVVGSLSVMDILQRNGLDGEDLFASITSDVRRRLDSFEEAVGMPLGLEVVAVEALEGGDYKNPTEPHPVSGAFGAAQVAGTRRNQFVEQGRQDANTLIEEARGRAEEIRARARSESVSLVQDAQAAAMELTELMPIYKSSPEEAAILRQSTFFRAWLSLAINGRILFVLHDNAPGTNRQMHLNLGGPAPPKQVDESDAEHEHGE